MGKMTTTKPDAMLGDGLIGSAPEPTAAADLIGFAGPLLPARHAAECRGDGEGAMAGAVAEASALGYAVDAHGGFLTLAW